MGMYDDLRAGNLPVKAESEGSDYRLPSVYVGALPEQTKGDQSVGYGNVRDASASEREFFRTPRGKSTPAYAADDGSVVFNPDADLDENTRGSLLSNERARQMMRRGGIERPSFEITPAQRKAFSGYSQNDQDIRETIAARIAAGDPSSGDATPEQSAYADRLRAAVGSKFGGGSNESFFKKYHEGVVSSGRALNENGTTTTMRIASVGVDGKTYLIPTYDPETKTVLPIDEAVRKAMPAIRSGELRPYDSPEAAEADRAAFEPRIVGGPIVPAPSGPPARRRTMYDELRDRNSGHYQSMMTPDQAAQVHPQAGAGFQRPPWQSPVQMTQPNATQAQQAIQHSQTHGVARPQAPADADAAARLARTTGQQIDQTMLAPRNERLGAAQILQTGGRMGIEAAAAVAGGSIPGRLAARGIVKEVGPVAKAVGTAIGSGVGSLLAEGIDPSEDPLSVAGYSALFSAAGDSIALGVAGARRSMAAAAATRGERVVKGTEDAVRLLGPGNLPTPGRFTTGMGVDTMENIAERAFGSSRVAARNARAQARAQQLIRDEVAKYAQGATREEVDRMVIDLVEGRHGLYSAAGRKLYQEVDAIAGKGVPTDGLIKLRNAIVTEFRQKAEARDLEPLIDAVDRVLGVPPSMRGIERGVMLDPVKTGRRYDPNLPGPWVIQGGDPNALMMQPHDFVTDPVTGLPVRSGAAQKPTAAPVVIEGATAGDAPAQAAQKRFTTDPKTGELVEATPEQPDSANVTQGRLSAQEQGSSARFIRESGGWVDIPPNARGEITFEEMNSLRSAMARVGRGEDEIMKGARQGQAKRIAGEADNILQASGAALENPQAFEAFRNANAFWKSMYDTFDDNVMLALMNGRPDDVFNTIMRADSPQQIGKFRKMLFGGLGQSERDADAIVRSAKATLSDSRSSAGQKALAEARLKMAAEANKAWTTFQGRYFMRMLENADSGAGIVNEASRGERTLSGKKLMNQWDAFGADANAEVFPNVAQRKNAEQLFRTLEITQAGTGSDKAKWAIVLAQTQAAVTFIYHPNLWTGAGAVVINAGPLALGRLLDNERFIHWVITSKKYKPGSEATARAVAQVMAIAAKEGARVVLPNGERFEPEERVPKAREARDMLGIANRRGGYR